MGTNVWSGRSWLCIPTANVLLVAALLFGCAGPGGEQLDAAVESDTAEHDSQRLAIARRLYGGLERTPAGFQTEPVPAGITGCITTVHVKSATTPAYELCSEDLAEVIAWSEDLAVRALVYPHLVEVRVEERFIEVVRVAQERPDDVVRHRVFRCGYVDRRDAQPAHATGPGGQLNARPLDAGLLQDFVEYVWQFTLLNNADHVVVASAVDRGPGYFTHHLQMARLHPATGAQSCDQIELFTWEHQMHDETGALSRRMLPNGIYLARRRPDQTVELC